MTEKLAELFSDPAQGRTAGMPPDALSVAGNHARRTVPLSECRFGGEGPRAGCNKAFVRPIK
jgi:hypothetical protein